MQRVDFWISIGSTYAYLTVARIDAAAASAGVTVRWRPFDTRTVMQRHGNSPRGWAPIKLDYMWRDVGRRAAALGLTPRLPAPYPLSDLARANRVAVVGMRAGWGPAYIRETYRRWFDEGAPAGEEPNLSESLAAIGADPAAVLDEADAAAAAAALADETEAAMRARVFGVPSFVVGDELFWGDDRLEEALDWARGGPVS